MKSLWLYLHFPYLQLDSLYHSASDDQPVVIYDEQANQVVQLNSAAQQAGIQPLMGLGSAAALCQALQVVPYQEEIERQRLTEIAHSLYALTSDISFSPPNGLFLRVHHMLSLYGGLQAYWHALQHPLQQWQLRFHYATGPSPLGARLLARSGWDQITDDRAQLRSQLQQCKLTCSDLSKKVVHGLQRVNIQTIGDLLAIPLKELSKRFEHDVVMYLGRLTGEFHHPQPFFHPPEAFQRYIELLYEIDNTEVLTHPITHLLKALQAFLALRDRLTDSLQYQFMQRDKPALSLTVNAAEGEYRLDKWLALTRLRLERLNLEAPVYAIRLQTGHTYVRQPAANDLFSGSRGTLSSLQLVSLLQARLGEEAVFSIRADNEHRPELSTARTAPLSDSGSVSLLPAVRPSFLLTNPQPLTEKVSILHGPERLTTGWWDNRYCNRDYFIAHGPHGQWYWVFRTPDNQWFLHGLFS